MMEDDFSKLVKAAADRTRPTVHEDFESRVMLAVACRAIERSRRRVRFGLVASLSGVATITAAACVAVVVWLPPRVMLSFDLGVALETVISSIRALF